MRAYMRACLRACVRACVCAFVCLCGECSKLNRWIVVLRNMSVYVTHVS